LLLKRTEENEGHEGAENNFVANGVSDSSCNEEQTTSVNKFQFYKQEMVDSNFYQTISRFLC